MRLVPVAWLVTALTLLSALGACDSRPVHPLDDEEEAGVITDGSADAATDE